MPPRALAPSLLLGDSASRFERVRRGLTADHWVADFDVLLSLLQCRTYNEVSEPLLTRSDLLDGLCDAHHRTLFRSSTHTRRDAIGVQSHARARK